MTLLDLLSTLKTNNVQVTVKDLQDNEVCKIYASSFAALDESVKERVISRWQIQGASALNVVINDPVEAKPDDSSDDGNNSNDNSNNDNNSNDNLNGGSDSGNNSNDNSGDNNNG